MFVTTELARRVEAMAAREGAELVEALQGLEPDGTALSEQIAGGTLVLCGPGMFVNRAIGLGMDGPVTASDVERVEALSAQVGVPAEFEVCPLADTSLVGLLAERGYRLEGFRSVLVCDLAALARQASGPSEIAAVDDGSLHAWQACAHVGFEIEDEPSRQISDRFTAARYRVEGETLFLAQVNGETAGCAAVSVREGLAELGGTATRPAFRRAGVQGDLIAHRLALALEAGCDVAVSAANPGSSSERNLKRFGFALAYTQVFLTRPD